MANSYFQFKQFTIHQDRCAMKVTTDGCLFGAWAAGRVGSRESLVRSSLDIGTGSGLLALMLAQESSFSIDAIEMDKDAFEQALENVAASSWANRIKIIHADVRGFEFPNQYDIIICNPPFYENELKADDVKKNIARHNKGLLLPELLSIIKKNLKPDGGFFLLLPYKRNEEIRKMLTESDLAVQQLTFVRQSTKHDFIRIMLEGKLKPDVKTEIMIDEISIKNDFSATALAGQAGSEDQYTPALVNLLKQYYLHL